MKKVIHVNRHNVAANKKDGKERPTLTVKTYKSNHRGRHVEIDGPSLLMDASLCNRHPLACGATVWIETDAPVRVDGRMVR